MYYALQFGDEIWTPKENRHIKFENYHSFKKTKLKKFFKVL